MKYLDDYDVLMSKRSQLDGLVFLRTLHPGPEGHTNKSSLRESNYILSPSGLTLHSSFKEYRFFKGKNHQSSITSTSILHY